MKSSFLLLLCFLSCAACVSSVPPLPEQTEERPPENVEQLVEQLFRRHGGTADTEGTRGRAVMEAPPAYGPLAEPSERLKRFCAEGNGVFSRTGGPHATAEAVAMSEGASAKDVGRLRAVDRSGAFGQFVCVREDVPVWTASIEPLSYTGIGSRAGGGADAGARMGGGAPDALDDQGRAFGAQGEMPNGGVDPLSDQGQPLAVPPMDAPACKGDGTTPCDGAMMRVAVTARSAPVAGF